MTVFPRYGDSHVTDKMLRDHLTFNMGIRILVKHLYIKMAPTSSLGVFRLIEGFAWHIYASPRKFKLFIITHIYIYVYMCVCNTIYICIYICATLQHYTPRRVNLQNLFFFKMKFYFVMFTINVIFELCLYNAVKALGTDGLMLWHQWLSVICSNSADYSHPFVFCC